MVQTRILNLLSYFRLLSLSKSFFFFLKPLFVGIYFLVIYYCFDSDIHTSKISFGSTRSQFFFCFCLIVRGRGIYTL
uniref:Uncharacterized protein n=1 Tax=Salix viminalis TaxID=40686 RepID=A0A6N2LAM2_SALVM